MEKPKLSSEKNQGEENTRTKRENKGRFTKQSFVNPLETINEASDSELLINEGFDAKYFKKNYNFFDKTIPKEDFMKGVAKFLSFCHGNVTNWIEIEQSKIISSNQEKSEYIKSIKILIQTRLKK